MAKRWLRGPIPLQSGGNWFENVRGTTVLLYFYFRYLLGATYVDTKSSLFDFDSCEEDTGADGVVTNSDFTFTAASASFTAGDVGKFIVIVDSTNEVNCGIHKIATYVSGTQVTLDWYSTDYPTAATGLTWYLVDSTVGSDLAAGEGAVFDFVHAGGTSWTMFMYMYDQSANDRLGFEFANASASWDAVTHDWKGSAERYTRHLQPHCGYAPTYQGPRIFAYGDTDFNAFALCLHTREGVGPRTFAGWCVLDPMLETGHTAKEKFFVFGMNGATHANTAERDGDASYAVDYGEMYYETFAAGFYLARWCGWYVWDGSGTGEFDLFKQSYTAPNHRHGTEFDGLPIFVQIDAGLSAQLVWQIIGTIPKDHLWLTACHGIGDVTLFGSDQYMHITHGVTIPWPGVNKV